MARLEVDRELLRRSGLEVAELAHVPRLLDARAVAELSGGPVRAQHHELVRGLAGVAHVEGHLRAGRARWSGGALELRPRHGDGSIRPGLLRRSAARGRGVVASAGDGGCCDEQDGCGYDETKPHGHRSFPRLQGSARGSASSTLPRAAPRDVKVAVKMLSGASRT